MAAVGTVPPLPPLPPTRQAPASVYAQPPPVLQPPQQQPATASHTSHIPPVQPASATASATTTTTAAVTPEGTIFRTPISLNAARNGYDQSPMPVVPPVVTAQRAPLPQGPPPPEAVAAAAAKRAVPAIPTATSLPAVLAPREQSRARRTDETVLRSLLTAAANAPDDGDDVVLDVTTPTGGGDDLYDILDAGDVVAAQRLPTGRGGRAATAPRSRLSLRKSGGASSYRNPETYDAVLLEDGADGDMGDGGGGGGGDYSEGETHEPETTDGKVALFKVDLSEFVPAEKARRITELGRAPAYIQLDEVDASVLSKIMHDILSTVRLGEEVYAYTVPDDIRLSKNLCAVLRSRALGYRVNERTRTISW